MSTRSNLAKTCGYDKAKKWKKLFDKIPEHQNSCQHKVCYLEWRAVEKRIFSQSTISDYLFQALQNETNTWKKILRRLLDVTMFLGERGLAFRGKSNRVGDSNNGNFLGILELISHYDPILEEHLKKVKAAQQASSRLQVHYLSPDSQNEFICCCAKQVTDAILLQRESSKYYSIIVDATPDSAHVKQTVFILRYVYWNNELNTYSVQEKLLDFMDCNKKKGEDIAALILNVLKKHQVPLTDCRGQGYDNGSNMSGCYKGAQAYIQKENALAFFLPCACHSLNLCGVHAAECCPQAITFFGTVGKLYNLFSSSPQRWEILQDRIGCSLHQLSTTRWSARLQSVKAFAAHSEGIKVAIKELEKLNLTSETKSTVRGIYSYLNTFECIVMSSMWLKILAAIDLRNTLLQSRDATLDVEAENMQSLVTELEQLRNDWGLILRESKLVAENLKVEIIYGTERRKVRRIVHENGKEHVRFLSAEEVFKIEVFYAILDNVLSEMSGRFQAMKTISKQFNVLWKYLDLSDESIEVQSRTLCNVYCNDISPDVIDELKDLKKIHLANIDSSILPPFELLNKLHKLNLNTLFPNICVLLRIFCTLPISVAEAERSFSMLARVKNVLHSTMSQDRLTSLGVLAIECQLARQLNFDKIIDDFASRKARKAPITR